LHDIIEKLQYLLSSSRFRRTIIQHQYLQFVCDNIDNVSAIGLSNDEIIKYLVSIESVINTDIDNNIINIYHQNKNIIYTWKKQYMMSDIVKLYMHIVCICDNYFIIKNTNIIYNKFFNIVIKLPLELQMLMSNIVYGVNDNYIPSNMIDSICLEILQ